MAFYKLHRAENEQKRREFTEGGGAPEDLYRSPMPTKHASRLFAEYRRRRAEYLANIEKEKEENLRTKLQIIEELRSS